MARPEEANQAALVKLWSLSFLFDGQPRLGLREVQLGEDLLIAQNEGGAVSHFVRKFRQNTFDFLAFSRFGLTDFIVEFHHRHGLDKDGCPGRTAVMHNPGNSRSALGFYRYHIAIAAQGNHLLLQGLPGRSQDLFQRQTHFILKALDAATNAVELLTGTIFQLFFAENAVINSLLQLCTGGKSENAPETERQFIFIKVGGQATHQPCN